MTVFYFVKHNNVWSVKKSVVPGARLESAISSALDKMYCKRLSCPEKAQFTD